VLELSSDDMDLIILAMEHDSEPLLNMFCNISVPKPMEEDGASLPVIACNPALTDEEEAQVDSAVSSLTNDQ
jgi:hypothetical protein